MHVLIVRACAIGDFVLHLPALRALAAAHPSARFTLVGYPETLGLARPFLPIEAIHSIEAQPWASLFVGPVSPMPFDVAWVWMNDSVVADNLRRSGVSEVFHRQPFPTAGHAADHLLQTVGLPAPELPDLWDRSSSRVILHPGSGSPTKVWPWFDDLARILPDSLILLGPAETPPKVSNARLENLSITRVAEELRQCRLFIGNDSGITHIAAYWGTPAIALFGPTDPGIWGPLGRRVRVLKKTSLPEISPYDVMKLL